MIIVSIKNIDAIACTIKYLIDDEVELYVFLLINTGIIDIKLISSANHALNHLLDEITIIVLKIKIKKNIKFLGFKNIKKRTFVHIWGMSPKALFSLSF